MATCARETGMLFWKKRCDGPSIGPCDQCRLFICQMHGGIQGDGGLLCHACSSTEDSDSDSGSWFSWSSSSSSSSDGSSSGSDSWSGGDSSSSSDSGSSSSDSGGSSSC